MINWLVCYKIKKSQYWEIINQNVLADRIYVLRKVMNVNDNDIIVVEFTQNILENL